MITLFWVMMGLGVSCVVFYLGRAYENWKAVRANRRAREARRIAPARYLNLRGNSAEIQDVLDNQIGFHRVGYALGTAKQYVSWVMDTKEWPIIQAPSFDLDELRRECVDV